MRVRFMATALYPFLTSLQKGSLSSFAPTNLFPVRSLGVTYALVGSKAFNWLSAGLLVAGLVAAQILLGGWWYPALATPAFLLVGAAAVMAGLALPGVKDAPGAWCTGLALAFAVYLFWRQSSSPDSYAAQADTWLVLGALSVYLTVAWQLRATGSRWLVLGVLFALLTGQVFLAVAQFAADIPFHPWAKLARHMALPTGDVPLANHGWISGTLASRTALAGTVEVTAFLALGMLVWGRGGAAVKLVLLWVAAVGFTSLSLSLSRSAYLGLPVGVTVFALLSFFLVYRGALAHRGLLAAGALTLVVLSLGLAVAAGAGSLSVQLRVAELGLDEYREKLWFITVPPMLSLDPWLGAGANMFDQLSLRYRGTGFTAKPVHAHNDWLQLLVEYGRVGFLLGAAFFCVHLCAGWRNAMRLVRETAPDGILPQSFELGLCTGSVAALAAVGAHAVFDYSLHIPAVALLVALAAGFLSAARIDTTAYPGVALPQWLRSLALLPLIPGTMLLWSVAQDGPAEYRALQAENALMAGEPALAWDLAIEGLALRPTNARLLVLAGESAGQLGDTMSGRRERREWYWRAAQYFSEAVRERPLFAYAWRERGLALDAAGKYDQALPSHLRAIARDPDHARGYEYLALHYYRQGRVEEAGRLFRLAQQLPGSRLAASYLRQMEAGQNSF